MTILCIIVLKFNTCTMLKLPPIVTYRQFSFGGFGRSRVTPTRVNKNAILTITSGFRGVWLVGLLSLRESTPCRLKKSPFLLFCDIHFWLNDTKNVSRAAWAPKYTNFEGEARAPKNSIFWSTFSKKCS